MLSDTQAIRIQFLFYYFETQNLEVKLRLQMFLIFIYFI